MSSSSIDDHLTIRPPRADDAAELYRIVTHRDVARHTLIVPSMRLSQTEEWLTKWSKGNARLVAERDGRPVGSIGLHRSDNPRRCHAGTIGMSVHPDYWGLGVGSALMAAILDIADNWLNLVRVELDVFADNPRARRLYERSGFELEATKRMAAYGDGRWVDAHLMARIRPPASHPMPDRARPPAAPADFDPDAVVTRPLQSDDADDIYAFFYQPAVARHTAQMPYYEPAVAQERFGQRRPGEHSYVAEADGRVIGLASLHQQQNPRLAHSAGLGMSVHPAYWGRGVGSKLMAALMDLADNWLNLKRVELEVNVDNPAGVRLYERFDFEREGQLRYHLYGDGRWANSYLMARLRK